MHVLYLLILSFFLHTFLCYFSLQGSQGSKLFEYSTSRAQQLFLVLVHLLMQREIHLDCGFGTHLISFTVFTTVERRIKSSFGGVGSSYVTNISYVRVRGGFGKHPRSIKDTAAVQLP